jgi:lipopolysaccharide transport system ATP-binding protein
LIGPNGAGKSTLLKMLNGLIKPDQGRITMRGRVGSLIELGAGFNPILTGRENIFVNGSVLGFRKTEIDRNLDAIIDFAEIEESLDTPVQNYSSGMKVRLGFAIAAQMEPDILLIDEVLAVGDAGFQMKCFNKINEISQKAAVLFVSHSMNYVARISSGVLLLNKGIAVYSGKPVQDGINRYMEIFQDQKMLVSGSGLAKLMSLQLSANGGHDENNLLEINHGDDFRAEMELSIDKHVKKFRVNVAFFDRTLQLVAECSSLAAMGEHFSDLENICILQIDIPNMVLNNGLYSLAFSVTGVGDNDWGEVLLRCQNVKRIKVNGGFPMAFASVQLPSNWSLK